jgi:hypothetical protein
MSSISVDVDIEDILWGMSDWEKQQLVDDLFDDGYIAKKDPRSGESSDFDWDEAVTKLMGNKWRLSKEDEETILRITNKIIA